MTVSGRAVRGVFWAYGSFGLERLANLAASLGLARALTPADFGLIAFAMLVVGFADAFRELGVRDALIWVPEPVEPAASTAFWLGLGLGLLLAGTLLTLAPFSAVVIDDPRAVPILRALALTPLIGSLGMAHEALLMRELSFGRRYAADALAALAKAAVAIGLVLAGAGVWALVAAQLVSTTVRAVGRWVVVPWRPRLTFAAAEAGKLLRYGLPIFAAGLLDVFAERIDQMVVAAMLGSAELGYYYLAARVSETVLTGFNIVLTRVAFPAFAALRHDRAALVEGLEAAMRFTAYVLAPVAVGMAAVSPELIRVLFGDAWLPAAPILSVLALAALIASLVWAVGDAVKAIGRPTVSTWIGGANLVCSFAAVASFASLSGSALAAAFGILTAAATVATAWLAVLHRFFRRLDLLRSFGPPLWAALAMTLAVEALRAMLAGHPAWLVLCAAVPSGAVVYGAVLWAAAAEHLRTGLRHIGGALRPAAGGRAA